MAGRSGRKRGCGVVRGEMKEGLLHLLGLLLGPVSARETTENRKNSKQCDGEPPKQQTSIDTALSAPPFCACRCVRCVRVFVSAPPESSLLLLVAHGQSHERRSADDHARHQRHDGRLGVGRGESRVVTMLHTHVKTTQHAEGKRRVSAEAQLPGRRRPERNTAKKVDGGGVTAAKRAHASFNDRGLAMMLLSKMPCRRRRGVQAAYDCKRVLGSRRRAQRRVVLVCGCG